MTRFDSFAQNKVTLNGIISAFCCCKGRTEGQEARTDTDQPYAPYSVHDSIKRTPYLAGTGAAGDHGRHGHAFRQHGWSQRGGIETTDAETSDTIPQTGAPTRQVFDEHLCSFE